MLELFKSFLRYLVGALSLAALLIYIAFFLYVIA